MDDYTTLFGYGYDSAGTCQGSPSLLEAICYPCSVWDSDSYSYFSPYISYHEDNPCEEEALPYSNWRNWVCEDDNWFCGSAYQEEEQSDISYVGHYESAESWHSCGNRPWSGYESWVGYEQEEDSNFNCMQEPIYPYGYSLDEMGLCEGILGYWPCLNQEYPKAHVEGDPITVKNMLKRIQFLS